MRFIFRHWQKKVPKVNVNAFGVVNLEFAAYEYGAGLREIRVRFLSLVVTPHFSRFARLAYGAFYFAV